MGLSKQKKFLYFSKPQKWQLLNKEENIPVIKDYEAGKARESKRE